MTVVGVWKLVTPFLGGADTQPGRFFVCLMLSFAKSHVWWLAGNGRGMNCRLNSSLAVNQHSSPNLPCTVASFVYDPGARLPGIFLASGLQLQRKTARDAF